MASSPNRLLNRRSFLAASAAVTSAVCLDSMAAESATSASKYKICAFIKFIQSLSFDELADTTAELGFDGIEATVRRDGYILPERVEEDLAQLVDALKKRDLEISVMTTNVNRVDPLSEKVLRTAASLGVKRYRMENYRYDLKRPVVEQLSGFASQMRDLVALNRELDIIAVYQNHSGAAYFGATLWDLHALIEKYPVSDVGVAFDIRHATVEGGLSWPTYFNLMQPHLGAVYVKDFRWNGRTPQNVPLGDGQVDPQFFTLLKQSKFDGPVSLHVEYLPDGGLRENIAALKNDLGTLQKLLNT